MKKHNNLRMVTGLVFVIAMVWSTAALAYDVQQMYRNDCGETAYDLMKVIEPEVEITTAIHDGFANHTWWNSNGKTYLKFYDGRVKPGYSTWACFDFESSNEVEFVEVTDAYWTDSNADGICTAGSPVGSRGDFHDPGGETSGDATITLTNRFELFEGGTITIYGTNVHYAVSANRYTLEQLNEGLFTNPDLTWNSLPDSTLPYEGNVTYDVTDIPVNQYLIFYCETAQEGGVNPTVELFQFPTYQQAFASASVPILNEQGMIVLSLLLLGAAAVAIVRRLST
jgi:hypothetical protein